METESRINDLPKMGNKKELYHAPLLEVFEIKVEKGFAVSGTGTGNSAPSWGDGGAW